MGSRLAVVGIALAAVAGAGCVLPVNFVPRSADPYAPAGPVTRATEVVDVTTPLAIAAALYQRSNGECFATCPGGTQCNPKTGACERPPCGGTCRQDEQCVASPTREWCALLVDPVRRSSASSR